MVDTRGNRALFCIVWHFFARCGASHLRLRDGHDFERRKVAREAKNFKSPMYENFIFAHESCGTTSKYTEHDAGKLEEPPMKPGLPCLILRTLIIALFPLGLAAQTVTLSGTATDAKGNPIANAAVSLKPATGPPIEVRTDANGNYSIPNLAPGGYTLSAAGDGLRSKQIEVTVTDAPHQTEDLLLAPELPNAPAAAPPPSRRPQTRRLPLRSKTWASHRSRRREMRNCRRRWRSARACCGFIRSSG